MKVCKKCGEEKPHAAFHKHSSTRDRLNPWCGDCKAAWLREHRRDNPEYWRNYNRRYKAKNREKIAAQRRTRYQADPARGARKALLLGFAKTLGCRLRSTTPSSPDPVLSAGPPRTSFLITAMRPIAFAGLSVTPVTERSGFSETILPVYAEQPTI